MEKQIEKILEILNIAWSESDDKPLPFRKFTAQEIAALYKGWYPGEFIEWKDWQMNLRKVIHHFKSNTYKFEGKKMTLSTLFKFWQDNVEGK